MVSHTKTHNNNAVARPFQVVPAGQPLGIDGATILHKTYPPLQWLVPNLIPRDFNMISAPPKAGKSMFALMCALKVATRPTLEGMPAPSVLYISPDDTDQGGVQERINMLLGGTPLEAGRLEFWFHDVERLDTGLLDQIAHYLDAHHSCEYVVIDVYNSVKPERTSDDIQKHDHSAMAALRSFVERYGIALTLINHNNKRPQGGDRAQRISGSYGLTGGVHTYMQLERDDDSANVLLYRRGRRGGDGCFAFNIEQLDIDFEPILLNEPPEDMSAAELLLEAEAAQREREAAERRKRPHVPGRIEQKLLDTLADGQDWAPKALAEAVNITHGVVKVYLRRMYQRGSVTLLRYGVYQLPRVTVTSVTLQSLPGVAAPDESSRVTRVTVTLPEVTPPKVEYFAARMQRYLAQGMKPKQAEAAALEELRMEMQGG